MGVFANQLWLFLGTTAQLLGFGRWMTPLAAWLAPIFLLHFAHSQPPLIGMLWVWFAIALAMGVSLRGLVPIPGLAYLALPIVYGLFGALPYLVDGLVAPLLPGFWGTLIFPATAVAVEFLNSRINPYGTWGATGYTQYGVLPLMQLASVTGIWGIGFMISWLAAVVNWAWDQQFQWPSVQHGVLIFFAITCVILILGGLRIVLAPERQTVRIAGIGWPKGIIEREQFMLAVDPNVSAEVQAELKPLFAKLHDSFLSRSEREARAGAKIIVWPEANLIVFQEDETAFLERAQEVARKHKVYIVMGLATLHPGERHSFRNHSVLLSPEGDTLYDYTKITAVPGFEKMFSIPGDQPIPFALTEFGQLASPICFDMDFDRIVRQVGRGSADMMLVPASDWKEILPIHQQMAEFRAIENGCVLFRITRWGASGAVDPYGRQLASMDDFSTEDAVMVAQVPTSAGVYTLYTRIGDVFGWACVAGLVAGIALLVGRAI